MKLVGEDAIIGYLAWNKSKFQKYRKIMKDDGVLICEWHGRPPKKRIFAWSNRLEIWTEELSRQGKIL